MSQSKTLEPAATANANDAGVRLFVVGFLVLFLELACIRWFSSFVIFLQFFTNIVLLACFLGMTCGCMAARSQRDWLALFPSLTIAAVAAALGMFGAYFRWSGVAIDVGQHSNPQEIFFGTEHRSPDVSTFTIPIEAVMAAFFVLIALMFVGLGQALGRAFDECPDRIKGYTANIAGSLLGIAAFSLVSFLQAPAAVWFLTACVGVAWLLRRFGALSLARLLALIAIPCAIAAIEMRKNSDGKTSRWSPYYLVEDRPEAGGVINISVGTIGHQAATPFAEGGAVYSLVHLLQKHSGGQPFGDVLIIGAGSGNDLNHALRFGVKSVDAVEIDPVIQDIGVRRNPDQPYQDPRVTRILDDGRHYLKTTTKKYDLVIYALVDSLVLHSGFANIRLESYLFTEQALMDIKNVLKPDGSFVTYNVFRQGWIVERVAGMARKVFGCDPLAISLPYKETIKSSDPVEFAALVTGCNGKLAGAFNDKRAFWLNTSPPVNMTVNGFEVRPGEGNSGPPASWEKIAPATIVHEGPVVEPATDDWPFLYLHSRLIPELSLRSMAIVTLLGVGMVFWFLPKGGGARRIDWRMFFLGAGFMLLETKAVVQLALLFGSTWIVNSMVFFAVLVLALLANLLVIKVRPSNLSAYYVGLFVMIAAAILTPTDAFLEGGWFWRYVLPCFIAVGPMFFAGVIFATSFARAENPDMAFGSNIAGSIVGGVSEAVSMLTGFKLLLLLAAAYYIVSAMSGRASSRV